MILELLLLSLGSGLIGSGAIRKASAKERHHRAVEQYSQVLREIDSSKAMLEAEHQKLGTYAYVAFGTVQQANRVLEPLNWHKQASFVDMRETNAAMVLKHSSELMTSYSGVKAAAAGTVVGTTLALGSWTAVSMLGTASTGAAIGTLHGAAATNAALAWFGGGSLATSGGGMIAGKLASANIVFLPVVAIAGLANGF